MADQIEAIIEVVAKAIDVPTDKLIGRSICNVLMEFEQLGNRVLWGLYNRATLKTIITKEHIK